MTPFVEITGTGAGNKGAELMLAALVAHLGERHPGLRLGCSPGLGPFAYRARHGLWQMLGSRGRRQRVLGWVLTAAYRERFGLVEPRDRVALIDASGYALGDPWRAEWVESAARHFEEVRASGGKVILLPQALGPFRNTRIRAAAAKALSAAHLVFARDTESHAAAKELLPDATHIHLGPDFTNLLAGLPVDGFARGQGRVALVPNNQMLVHGDQSVRDGYVGFFVAAAKQVLAAGLRPILLLHEDRADRPVASAIQGGLGGSLDLVTEADPIRLKGLIGSCELVIGSRFHALVSALSQGVPVLGTSWSHKYEHLFADYGVKRFLVQPEGTDALAASGLELLLDTDYRKGAAAILTKAAEVQKDRARAMWVRVDEVLTTLATYPESAPGPSRRSLLPPGPTGR